MTRADTPRRLPAAELPGSFVISFDAELIWGSFDHTSPAEFERRYPDVRRTIRETLALLASYEVPTTWAILGHLYLRGCTRGADGLAHPELVRPVQRWRPGDWYAADPCTDRERDPLWYGDDIVDLIQDAGPLHEIGCHSFGHVLYDDPDLSAEAARSDLAACIDLAAARGISLRSFVFPRNREGHHALLKEAGFTAFRGADPTWHAKLPGVAARLGHLVDQAVAIPPPVSVPTERLPGLWDIPGSMLLMNRTGVRRFVPYESRVRKARAGLRRAARDGGVFHLWMHPFNIASDRVGMLAALESTIVSAVRLRDAGKLRIETMGALTERLSGADRHVTREPVPVMAPPVDDEALALAGR
jgi:peptidoglycan/xylan/chitin deacetylase (PgdA/CDA1 family)